MMPKCSARKPSRADAGSLVISVPRISICPDCGATMPQIRLRKVDLPLPDGPISRMRLAVGRAKLSTASEKALRPGQTKRTSDMAMTSCVAARGMKVAATITFDRGSDHAGETKVRVGACNLEFALPFRRDDIDVELLGAGERAEIAELDRRHVARGCAFQCVLGVELGMPFALCGALPGPRVLGVMVVLTVLDLHLGLRDTARGGGRQSEEGQRRHQLRLCLLDGRLVAARLGRVLEADEVHPGHLQLHGHLVAFHGNVERSASVLVDAKLTVLIGGE